MKLAELREKLLADELAVTTLEDGTGVLVNLAGLTVFTFNQPGMCLIRKLTEGAAEIEALVDELVLRFDVDRSTARADTESFIENLSRALVPR